MATFTRTLNNTIPLDQNNHSVAVMAGFDSVTETAVPLRVTQSAGGDWLATAGTSNAALMGAIAIGNSSAAEIATPGGTAGTSVSAAAPATATTAGDTLTLALNGEIAQTITLATSASGAAVAADIQAKVRALTAASAANQAAYTAFTCVFTAVYTLTSGLPGAGSAVVVSAGTAAVPLKLGLGNAGSEAAGIAKAGVFGHILWNTGSKIVYLGFSSGVTSATGIALASGASMSLDGANVAYTGAIWGICGGVDTSEIRGVAYL